MTRKHAIEIMANRPQIIGYRKSGAPIYLARGGAPRQSEITGRKLAEIQAELKTLGDETIDDKTHPEEAARTAAIDENATRTEALTAEYASVKADHDKHVAREAKVDEIMRASHTPGNREGGDAGARSPEFMRKVEPYDEAVRTALVESVYTGGSYDQRDTISRAMAAVERAPRHVDDKAKERMTELLHLDNRHTAAIARHMILTGSPEYHAQFRAYMQSKGTRVGELLRDAMSLTDGNGGFLVPFTLDPTIILTNAGVIDPIRQIATVKTITTDSWNGVTSAGVSAEWTAEGVEAADASPTFTGPGIPVHKADAWVVGSYEMLADSDFAGAVGTLMADAKARLEAAAFATGNTGATKPRGVVAAVAAVTTSIVTAAATGALAVGDIYNTADALRPRDAALASFAANKKIFSKIRQFDTAGGSAFWANLGMGRPNELLSAPAYEASSMAGAIASAANILLAGNFNEYYVIDRIGMSIMYDPMVKSTGNGRPTGQAGYYAFWRVGADVVDADAFRLLQLNTTAAATALA